MTANHTARPHHHGDLKEALIGAGIDLLVEGGLPALTLRKCAGRAGVSHAAPAHHFDGLKGLLTAIVTRGFEEFANQMNAASDGASDPRTRLLGICHGYLEFSRQNKALTVLMFMTDRLDTRLETFQRSSSNSYQILAVACAPFCTDPASQRTLEMLIWSMVQGYAELSRNGQVLATNAEFDDMFEVLNLQHVNQP
jgi:AcrR family transcriptional regulator